MVRNLTARSIASAAMCLALVGCQTNQGRSGSSFCEEKPLICVAIGAIVIGGVIALSKSDHDNHSIPIPAGGGGPVASDGRLKTGLRHVERLENGINLYAFRYKGDDRLFVGVKAEEIRADRRFKHAVVIKPGGYLAVDYEVLRLKVVNEAEMRAAGDQAIRRTLQSRG